ncbi:hypothetical protein [Oecophyllibacter saccharovorans]|uniref:Uncharacterized protein n=1 Tax=Oecophyllibacter saccharovorans TaxID=2558360 RepID=A0A506ULI8_9PROT|nr:hypothetical protein [Oecophyllibacter saccharovorans]QDH15196.1 hypothetical protein E3E11_04255 [Oecophyllibacter saccharovorans]TPW33757.1 hypothetical protein E3203_08170 [Oecophyllibacter saccharovorans]TPW34033.1 hypothetical protein E3202_05615 [Oecophyllibacter saccharovorans]
MPFITVVGASSQPFALNVASQRTNTLGSQFHEAIVSMRADAPVANASVGGADQQPAWGGLTPSSLPENTAVSGQHPYASLFRDTHLQASGLHPASVSGALSDTISAGGDLHLTQGVASHTDLSFISGPGSVTGAGQASLFGAHGQIANYLAQQAAARQSQQLARFDTLHGAHHNGQSILPQAASSHAVLNAWNEHQHGQQASVAGAMQADTVHGAKGVTVPGAQKNAAQDLLKFLDSSKAQHNVLKDFGSSAGNMVGLNPQHGQGGAQSAMSVLGGGLFDKSGAHKSSQITFLDDQYAQKHSHPFKSH